MLGTGSFVIFEEEREWEFKEPKGPKRGQSRASQPWAPPQHAKGICSMGMADPENSW